jgi:hypothetical protein
LFHLCIYLFYSKLSYYYYLDVSFNIDLGSYFFNFFTSKNIFNKPLFILLLHVYNVYEFLPVLLLFYFSYNFYRNVLLSLINWLFWLDWFGWCLKWYFIIFLQFILIYSCILPQFSWLNGFLEYLVDYYLFYFLCFFYLSI